MDITINPVSTAVKPYAQPALKNASPAASSVTQAVQADQAAAATPDADNSSASSEDSHEAAVRAALSFKNTYALGDQQFSIFKDATGKYITRYVSLRDGKVTYLPAPTFVRPSQSGSSGVSASPRIAISV